MVTVGPTCPVQIAGRPCPDRPLQTILTVAGAGSKRVVKSTSAPANGRFSIRLAPGRYRLTIRPAESLLKTAVQQRTVTVQRDAFTVLNLQFDSGIR